MQYNIHIYNCIIWTKSRVNSNLQSSKFPCQPSVLSLFAKSLLHKLSPITGNFHFSSIKQRVARLYIYFSVTRFNILYLEYYPVLVYWPLSMYSFLHITSIYHTLVDLNKPWGCNNLTMGALQRGSGLAKKKKKKMTGNFWSIIQGSFHVNDFYGHRYVIKFVNIGTYYNIKMIYDCR